MSNIEQYLQQLQKNLPRHLRAEAVAEVKTHLDELAREFQHGGLPRLGQKYNQGLNRAGDLFVYTSRGVGVVGPPIRFNCPPEATEITLVPAKFS